MAMLCSLHSAASRFKLFSGLGSIPWPHRPIALMAPVALAIKF